ncbi:hypothetical protein ACHAPT_009429 [Fusarium lateritium]
MARNLAIEKQRREALNENFLDLARLLPALASARRLTKVLIVNQSIEHLGQQRSMCIAAARDMQELIAENRQLVSEVNALRKEVGGPAAPPVHASCVTEAMEQLAGVEHQVLGTFPAGFGDNWAGDSPQADDAVRSEAPQEVHDVTSSMGDFFSAPAQQTSTGISPDNGIHVTSGQLAPPIPASGYQPHGNLDPCPGILNDPSFSAHPGFYIPTHSSLNDQLLANMPDPIDQVPSFWIQGLDMGDASGFLQHGYGDSWGLS